MSFSWSWHHYPNVTSTMDVARDLLQAHSRDLALAVIADYQSAGRGRRGRHWQSCEGNLFLTLAWRDQSAPEVLPQLSLVAASALHQVLHQYTSSHEDLNLKWPNDVLLNGRKMAGLLLESDHGEDTLVFLGVGVNLADCPADTLYPATSLKREVGIIVKPRDLAEAFAAIFEVEYQRWYRDGFANTRRYWQQHGAFLNQPITLGLMGKEQPLLGEFLDIEADGALRLKASDGREYCHYAGEITSMRPHITSAPF